MRQRPVQVGERRSTRISDRQDVSTNRIRIPTMYLVGLCHHDALPPLETRQDGYSGLSLPVEATGSSMSQDLPWPIAVAIAATQYASYMSRRGVGGLTAGMMMTSPIEYMHS